MLVLSSQWFYTYENWKKTSLYSSSSSSVCCHFLLHIGHGLLLFLFKLVSVFDADSTPLSLKDEQCFFLGVLVQYNLEKNVKKKRRKAKWKQKNNPILRLTVPPPHLCLNEAQHSRQSLNPSNRCRAKKKKGSKKGVRSISRSSDGWVFA